MEEMRDDEDFLYFPKGGLSLDQIDELFAAFTLFDKDHNGAISAKELTIIMNSIGQHPTSSEAQDMVREGDSENNNFIDFPEFVCVLARAAIQPSFKKDLFGRKLELDKSQVVENAQEAFKKFAVENEDYITAESFCQALNKIKEVITLDEVKQLIKESSIFHHEIKNKQNETEIVLKKDDFNCLMETIYHFDLNEFAEQTTHQV